MAKYRTILVAICALMMLGGFAAPVMGATSGQINGVFNTQIAAPTIVSITGSNTVNPAPDAYTNLVLTVTVNDPQGVSAITNVTGQLSNGMSGTFAPVIVTSPTTTINGTAATFTVNVPFGCGNVPGPQYRPTSYGTTWTVVITAYDVTGLNTSSAPWAVTLSDCVAMGIDSGAAPNYGNLALGATGTGTPVTVIHNAGNHNEGFYGLATNWASTGSGAAISATTLTCDGGNGAVGMGQTSANGGLGGQIISLAYSPMTTQPCTFVEHVPTSVSPFNGQYSDVVTITGSA